MIEAFSRGWKHGHLTEMARLRYGLKYSLSLSQELVRREDRDFRHTSGENIANFLGISLGNVHAVASGLYKAIKNNEKNRYPTHIVVELDKTKKR